MGLAISDSTTSDMLFQLNSRFAPGSALHEMVGVLILVLAAIRLINRLLHRAPPLPAEMPRGLQGIAHLSHYVLYFFMFAQPLLGWAMLSAARYPLPLHLPNIMPHSVELYATLRHAHGIFGLLFFVTLVAIGVLPMIPGQTALIRTPVPA